MQEASSPLSNLCVCPLRHFTAEKKTAQNRCRKRSNPQNFSKYGLSSSEIIPTQRDLNNSALVILFELLLVALISQFIRIIPAKKASVIISLSGVITGIVASGLTLYRYTDIIASFIGNCNMFFKIYTQYFQNAW